MRCKRRSHATGHTDTSLPNVNKLNPWTDEEKTIREKFLEARQQKGNHTSSYKQVSDKTTAGLKLGERQPLHATYDQGQQAQQLRSLSQLDRIQTLLFLFQSKIL
eukprot:2194743-Amphidinium_carterae.1